MEKYTYERLISERAEQVKGVRWPGGNDECREFTGECRAFAVSENHGEYDLPWIVVIKNGKETERINVRFLESIEWAS